MSNDDPRNHASFSHDGRGHMIEQVEATNSALGDAELDIVDDGSSETTN
jgi:hypothetical protein